MEAGRDQARDYNDRLVRSLGADVNDPRVLEAIRATPRHTFVPEYSVREAYEDHPLEIGHGATISQPLIVGIMSEALELEGTERVLEIGTGSGWQAAILSRLAREVHTIEVVPALASRARQVLSTLGYDHVHVHLGDGWQGLPEFAPFDRIVVTAAPERLPEALVEQLEEGGILVVPVGSQGWTQQLERWWKQNGRLRHEDLGAVRFVPMVHGRAQA